jgi:hypothetical protein
MNVQLLHQMLLSSGDTISTLLLILTADEPPSFQITYDFELAELHSLILGWVTMNAEFLFLLPRIRTS